MKRLFIIFFIILFSVNMIFTQISANDAALSHNFVKIITIDEHNKELIDSDFTNISYNKQFYFYCLVSGELSKYNEYSLWFNKIEEEVDNEIKKEFKNIKALNKDIDRQKQFAEYLLTVLHKTIFKNYRFHSNRISEIIEKGYFNCVSSSIMYAIFLNKYGFRSSAIETKDHVFIKVNFNSSVEIDVETTNMYGFDPGNKKEVLDEFGDVTGFTYVSPKNYRNRNEIDFKKLLLLIYHNLSEMYYKDKDLTKYANIGYIIYKGRNDEKGREEFEIFFNNYIAKKVNHHENLEAVKDINSYFKYFGINEKFIDMRFNTIGSYIDSLKDFENHEKIKKFLIFQNEMFLELKDHKKYFDIYYLYIYKVTKYYLNLKEYSKIYDFIAEIDPSVQVHIENDIKKIFLNTFLTEMQELERTGNYSGMSDRIIYLKKEFGEYDTEISKNEKIYLARKITDILDSREYIKAIDEAKKIYMQYPDDKNIKNAFKNCYVKYTIKLFDDNNLEELIKYSDEALRIFPGDNILMNNYLSFFINFINNEIRNKNYDKANQIYDIAIIKFPGNSKLIKYHDYLQKVN